MEMGLTEKIPALRKKDWNIHQKVEKVREPRTEWPKGSYQRHFQVAGAANFGKNPLDEAERRECICLEMIPRLDHRVYCRRLGIRHGRKVNLEAMVEGGGEQVHRHRPTAEKLQADIYAGGPLGAEDLAPAAERVRKNVEAPRDKLGEQTDSVGLAQAMDFLSHGVEG